VYIPLKRHLQNSFLVYVLFYMSRIYVYNIRDGYILWLLLIEGFYELQSVRLSLGSLYCTSIVQEFTRDLHI